MGRTSLQQRLSLQWKVTGKRTFVLFHVLSKKYQQDLKTVAAVIYSFQLCTLELCPLWPPSTPHFYCIAWLHFIYNIVTVWGGYHVPHYLMSRLRLRRGKHLRLKYPSFTSRKAVASTGLVMAHSSYFATFVHNGDSVPWNSLETKRRAWQFLSMLPLISLIKWEYSFKNKLFGKNQRLVITLWVWCCFKNRHTTSTLSGSCFLPGMWITTTKTKKENKGNPQGSKNNWRSTLPLKHA